MIQPNWRTILLMMLIIVLFNIGYSFLLRDAGKSAEISYSRFLSELAGNNLKTVSFKGTAANGEFLKKIKVSETVQGKRLYGKWRPLPRPCLQRPIRRLLPN